MHIAVGVTGASGAPLALRLLQVLFEQGHEVSLIVSPEGEHVMALEMGEVVLPAAHRYRHLDFEAPLASSSRAPEAMIVCPCSMRTLAAVAQGLGDNLITRCAENVMRLNRPLVVVPRETPLSLQALDNMRALRAAGALIVPPVMAYYFRPETVQDLTDFAVGKILDCLQLPHSLYRRWGEEAPK